MPTELDVYKPERWLDYALLRPEVRAAFRDLVSQGWLDAVRALHPDERRLHLLGLLPERPGPATPACASTICCSALRSRAG